MSLSSALNESITLYQDFEQVIPANQEWSFSVWYAITSSLGLTAPATGFGIEAVGYCNDGSTETIRAAFATNTGGEPTLLTKVGSYTKGVYKVRIQILCTHTGAFPFTDSVVVDLVQAEIGDTPTPWRPHPFDYWPHVTINHTLAPILIESGHRAQFVETMKDFWASAIPTRLLPKVGVTESSAADAAPTADGNGIITYGSAGRWVEVDQYGDEWPYEAVAYSSGSTHRIKFVGTVAADIFGDFDLAFRNYIDYFEIDTAITIEAITEYSGWLWAVLKKADHSGTTKRYLAIIDPRTPWPRPAYLEVFALLEIPEPSLSTLITRVEIRYEDQQHIYIGDGHLTFAYRLYYDYFTISGTSIFIREYPSSMSVIEAATDRKEYTKDLSISDFDRSYRRV